MKSKEARGFVRYEEIVEQYLNDLEFKLRNVSSNQDFLQMWVHDEDDAMSLLSMAESAATYGLKELSIEIGPKTLSRMNSNQWLKILQPVGQVALRKEGENTILEIQLHGKRP